MADSGPIVSLDALAAQVPDGALLAVPPDYSGVAMAATRALIRRGVKRLHLVAVPTSGLQTELLIGAGCVETIEAAAITLGEAGPAPRFSAAVKSGAVRIRDATCPAIHAALQAAEKGIPFMPLRGIIGTDILRHRTDWRTVQNPLAEGDDPIVLLPAIQPDIALFHVALADREGNVWVGRRRELVTMAHAAKRTLVTAETIQDGNLLEDERLAAGVIPSLYVSAIAEAERGAWPIGLEGRYEPDTAHIADYVRTARSEDGFRAYLAEHVLAGRRAA
ncbi:MAG: CoA transferase subunit A [Alphaproteobacteria bacterium]